MEGTILSKRIMIVDDSRVVHSQIKKILDGTDFEIVECCRDGESAIEAYGKYKPDLVTMDIIMPGMDGLEASRNILKQWPDARILMVSSLAYDDTIDEAARIGSKGFIYKPFKKDALINSFNRALQD